MQIVWLFAFLGGRIWNRIYVTISLFQLSLKSRSNKDQGHPKPCARTWCGRSSSSSSSQCGELRPLECCEGCDASHSEWHEWWWWWSQGQQPWCSENAESQTGDVGVGGGSPPPGSPYESKPRVGGPFFVRLTPEIVSFLWRS